MCLPQLLLSPSALGEKTLSAGDLGVRALHHLDSTAKLVITKLCYTNLQAVGESMLPP